MLQIDGSNVPCDTVWYISFKDGAQAIQFNRGSGHNPIFSFFGKHRDVDIISIDGIAIKVGEQSAQAKANEASPQTDEVYGRLRNILVDSR